VTSAAGCELCQPASANGAWRTVAEDERLRIVRVLDNPDHPAFYRVVWKAHVAEFSALGAADRLHCMNAVAAVERTLLAAVQPRKINLAALGNMVPHLHWHVIARFGEDAHFPQPIWGARQRDDSAERLAAIGAALVAVDAQMPELLQRAAEDPTT